MTKTEADLWLDYLFAPIRLIDAAAYAAGDESAPFFQKHRFDLAIRHVDQAGCLLRCAEAL